MNPRRPDNRQDQPRDEDLSRLYREAAHGEPPAALDRLILEAARGEAARAARPVARPWWRGWLAPVSLFATVVLTVTMTLLVHREQQREEAKALSEQRAPAAPVEKKADAEAGRAAEPARAPERLERTERMPRPGSRSSAGEGEQARRREDTPAAAPLGKAVPEAFPGTAKEEAAARSPSRSQESVVPPPAPTPDSLPPQPSAAAAPKPAPALQSAPSEAKQKAAPAAGAAAGAASELSRMRASRAEPQADKAVRPAEDWLEEIRALKKQGREREAQEALAQFRRAYPDYALPADLR
jgi:hypothetical protein